MPPISPHPSPLHLGGGEGEDQRRPMILPLSIRWGEGWGEGKLVVVTGYARAGTIVDYLILVKGRVG